MLFHSLALKSKNAVAAENHTVLNPAPLMQPKLKIGASNDKYEREADRVADQVIRKPAGQETGLRSQLSGSNSGVSIQRMRTGYPQNSDNEKTLRARVSSVHARTVTPNAVSGIQSLQGRGQPLGKSTRSYFEPRFGHDFSKVRIHVDNRSAGLADSIGAKAFTLGQDVVFGHDQYQPGSMEGRRLIAHELAHTVQQANGSPATLGIDGLSNVDSDRIQKDDDDDEDRRRRQGGFLSSWRFQFGVGPMRAPSPSGPAAGFFSPTPQLPIPGLFLNRGLGFQYGQGQFDFGVFPNLGGNTEFYGTRDIPRLLNPGSSQQQTPGATLPQIPLPGLQAPIPTPNLTLPTPPIQTPTPGAGIMPPSPLRGLRTRTIDSFVLNQSSLPSTAASELDSIVVWINLVSPAIVWVTGHTDASGSEQHNQSLSEARAENARQALIDRGVDASIIESSGEGESSPVVFDATSADQHARNRRVTIQWFDAIPPAAGLQLHSPWLNP